MKSKVLFTTSWLSLLMLLAMWLGLPAEAQAPNLARYTVTDLGTLGGPGTNSAAYDMNNTGWVAGSANLTVGGPQHAFLWYGRGPLIDLGTLGGPACPTCNSEAGGPNASGEAALISETSETDPNGEDFCGFGTHHQCLAAIWRNWKLTALATLPGGHNAQAYGLNNKGQVIGFAEDSFEDSSCALSTPFQVFRFETVIWAPNGEIQKLHPLPGDTVGFGFGINDHGQAVGSSGLCSNTSLPSVNPGAPHAVLWEKDGSAIDLGNLGGTYNVATSVNNQGEVVGAAQNEGGDIHAFLWTKDTAKMQDLGALAGDSFSVATCCNTINDSGQVVGFSFPGPEGSGRAFLWQDKAMTDLNTLIPAGSPWYLLSALSINDAGEIVGYGAIDGNVHAFLATPCDRNHSDTDWCKGDTDGATAEADRTIQRPTVVLSKNVRELLQQRLPFGRSVGSR